jgi:hypothetical protein
VDRGSCGPLSWPPCACRTWPKCSASGAPDAPRDDDLTQRGGTFLLDADNSLLYRHRDRGILGFSATMARPLSFLDPWLD